MRVLTLALCHSNTVRDHIILSHARNLTLCLGFCRLFTTGLVYLRGQAALLSHRDGAAGERDVMKTSRSICGGVFTSLLLCTIHRPMNAQSPTSAPTAYVPRTCSGVADNRTLCDRFAAAGACNSDPSGAAECPGHCPEFCQKCIGVEDPAECWVGGGINCVTMPTFARLCPGRCRAYCRCHGVIADPDDCNVKDTYVARPPLPPPRTTVHTQRHLSKSSRYEIFMQPFRSLRIALVSAWYHVVSSAMIPSVCAFWQVPIQARAT